MERDRIWIPLTPPKLIPSRSGYNCEASLPSVHGTGKENVNEALGEAAMDPISTSAVQSDTNCIQEEAVKVPPSVSDGKNAHGAHESEVGTRSVPSLSETKGNRKRQNDGIDLNKKPSQRPRMKKHRPKVYDDSKPKKVPKAQTPRASTRPKTPKPETPKRAQDRRNHSRKNKFTGSTSCMQSPTSYGLEKVAEDVQAASSTSAVNVKSCKRSLIFNYKPVKEESCLMSKSHEEPLRFNFALGEFDFFSKIVTSKRNTTRKSRFPIKSLKASDDLLGDDNKHQCQQDISVVANQEGAEKHVRRYDCVYQRRIRNHPNTTSCVSRLQVYHRTFKNNQCLQISKKLGPNFPRMFKRPRAKRKKATVNVSWWSIKVVESGKKNMKRSDRNLIQTTRRRVYKDVDKSKDKKGSNLCLDEWLLNVFSPKRRKRSRRNTRRREDIMDQTFCKTVCYDDEKCLPWPEENYLQIMECLPLQYVQRIDDSISNPKWLQLQEVPVLGCQSLTPRGRSKEDCNNLYVKEMTEILTRKLANLDINAQCKELVVLDHNASGALVKMDPPRKRKVLPKVELDEETLRVWKLLMENDGNEPMEETDKDKEEWWERQRKVFSGRVDSFIAKMHLIQGNRRFSPWKGSVVDSVVGVYLTQNVSDHLSSSAFMNLAARFPVKTRSEELDDHGEVPSSEESVISTTNMDGDFALSKNNEMEQDMHTPCADERDATPTVKLLQEVASNPILVQDKPCINGFSNASREHLDIEELDYLKEFYSFNSDESPLNVSRIDGDLSTSKGEGEEHGAASSDFPSSHEPSATMSDVKMGLCETSVVSNAERDLLGETNVDDAHLRYSENELILQQKSTPENPEIVTPVCSLHSEVTSEEGVVAISNTLMSLDTKSTGKKKSRIGEKQETKTDWEELRRTYCETGGREINENNMDAVDWDAVRRATVEEIAETIVERGMNNVLAARIKDFLERMVTDHGTIDLEWLRDVPPDKAKEFLLSIQGIGLKSVECVRLLTLHHLAFPVDTNVGRVATRLGWVPLQPLPEEVQIHLLNAYPMLDTIQKYLFPRLCTLDQRTLYELHYQLITFGKVFCTKIQPNCNACPMRAECRHYASAFASARLALPGSKESSVTSIIPATNEQNYTPSGPPPSTDLRLNDFGSTYHAQNCEPIIEIPPSPEPEVEEPMPIICDIEDYFRESDDEIPTIRLNTEEFKETLKETIDVNKIPVPEADMSKALVALASEAAHIRPRPMKFVAKLRTVHLVYELPDSHPCLVGFDEREHDDPTPYLLAIWLPVSGETSKSLDYTENQARDSSNNNHEETVTGTILIPCRTANRGKFPLNGTYFQVNEVFADDETSRIPMDVSRSLLWNLRRRDLGCGTSATSIFKGLPTSDIQHLFWRGSICVRGFNRKTRQPRPLHRRFHLSTTVIAAENRRTGRERTNKNWTSGT